MGASMLPVCVIFFGAFFAMPLLLHGLAYITLFPAFSTEDLLREESDRLKTIASEIAHSETVKRYMSERNERGLRTIAVDESHTQKVGNVIFADTYGATLAQNTLAERKGDHLPGLTRWGVLVETEGSVASISSCPVAPLLMVGGVQNENGAVYAIEYLDDEFAKRFRDQVLPPGGEVAFIALKEGLTGASFSNDTRSLLDNFTRALPFSGQNLFQLPAHLRINNATYFVRTTVLYEHDIPIGLVVMFVRTDHTTAALMIAAFAAVLFFVIHMAGHERLHERRKIESHGIVIVALSLVVLATCYAGIRFMLEGSAVNIREPAFIIYNSTMHLEPEVATLSLGNERNISIKVRTGEDEINAVEAHVRFDPTRVRVEEIIMDKSFCDPVSVTELSIDNERGGVDIACVVVGKESALTRATEATLGELILSPLSVGPTALTFDSDTQVLASDGLGTNVLRETRGALVQIFSDDSNSVHLASLSHPNSERWYAARKVEMIAFGNVSNTLEIRGVYDGGTVVPKKQEGSVSSFEVPVDGYFTFQAEQGDSLLTYGVRVDTEKPEPPRIRASTLSPRFGELVRFTFESSDNASGLQPTFYVQIDGGVYWPVGKTLFLPFFKSGEHSLIVRAFDMAGNYSESEEVLEVR